MLESLFVFLALRPAGPVPIRAERVRANAEAWIADHPTDPRGYELLGRLHVFQFVSGGDYVYGSDWEPLARLEGFHVNARFASYPPQWSRLAFRWQWDDPGPASMPSASEQIDHVSRALQNLRRALELDPNASTARLAYAFTLESAAHVAPLLDSTRAIDVGAAPALTREGWKHWEEVLTGPDSKLESAYRLDGARDWCRENWIYLDPLRADSRPIVQQRAARLLTDSWRSLAIEQYRIVMDAAMPAEAKLERPSNRELAGYESATALMRLLDSRDEASARLAARAKSHVAFVESLRDPPSRVVSPLVVSFATDDPARMIARSSSTCFDLDGDGVVESGDWVRSDTALLVWDPARSGRITSGRELFGEATFGLYPHDGFLALSLLDDDHDGIVAGRELEGVRLWFDRDGDGRSSADEIVELATMDVVGLRCTAVRACAIGSVVDDGVLLRGGRTRPLVDWLAERR